VENIVIGDRLMGPDSTPREVLETHSGRDKMLRIRSKRNGAFDFIVNMNHTFSVVDNWISPEKRHYYITGTELIKKNKAINTSHICLEKPWLVEFPKQKEELPLEPYMLGLWLGDGSHNKPEITNPEPEIEKYLTKFCKYKNMRLVKHLNTCGCPTFRMSRDFEVDYELGDHSLNPFIEQLRDLGIYSLKKIPEIYLVASEQERLELLAGLLDTDGYLDDRNKSTNSWDYEITVKQKEFAKGIAFLARSLGFSASFCLKIGRIATSGFEGEYWRVHITGDLHRIPCKVDRKKVKVKCEEARQSYGFSFEELPEDEYYGFEVDEDNLYLDEHFVIQHNSGKSALLGTFPGEVLDIYTSDEDHGISSATSNSRFSKAKITPFCLDVDPSGIKLIGDQVIKRMHDLLDSLLEEKTPSFKAIAIESMAGIEAHVRKTQDFLKATSYSSNEVNINKILEIVQKLKTLNQKGIHILVTCPATGTRDANGVFSQLTPVLTGYGCTDKVFGAFGDILVVGPVQVTDAETLVSTTQFCLQFASDFTKSGKTFTGIPRTINFRPRLSGLMQHELPSIINASLEELLVYRFNMLKAATPTETPTEGVQA
jgi:hypothetical protein